MVVWTYGYDRVDTSVVRMGGGWNKIKVCPVVGVTFGKVKR
jgi:hypothetical protein